MAAELKQTLGIDAELKPGSKGIFDVELEGKKIFSKYDVHRFPNPGEIGQVIAAENKGAK